MLLNQIARNIIKILMLRCAESRRIHSQYLDEKSQGWVDRFAYAGHWLSCRTCRRVHRQTEILERAILAIRKPPPQKMPHAAKQRIAAAIEKHTASPSRK